MCQPSGLQQAEKVVAGQFPMITHARPRLAVRCSDSLVVSVTVIEYEKKMTHSGVAWQRHSLFCMTKGSGSLMDKHLALLGKACSPHQVNVSQHFKILKLLLA